MKANNLEINFAGIISNQNFYCSEKINSIRVRTNGIFTHPQR
jgi:hypothetical protein